jgi:hypothetical protein
MSRVLAGEENRPGKFNDCRRLPGEEGIETANPVAGRLPPPGRRRDPPELYDFSVALGGPPVSDTPVDPPDRRRASVPPSHGIVSEPGLALVPKCQIESATEELVHHVVEFPNPVQVDGKELAGHGGVARELDQSMGSDVAAEVILDED